MDLHVERLTLRLSGLSTSDARRLAELVGSCLLSGDAPGAAWSAQRLQLRVEKVEGERLESMAERIATQVLAALARSS